MRASIKNLGQADLPVVRWVDDLPDSGTTLGAGQELQVDDKEIGRVDVGVNPSWSDEVKQGLVNIQTFINAPEGERSQPLTAQQSIRISVHNAGKDAIRVLCGSNLDEEQVMSDATKLLVAPGTSAGSGEIGRAHG